MPTTLADLSLDIVYMIVKEVHISDFRRQKLMIIPLIFSLTFFKAV
jgi:hypothetical protein